MRGQTYDSGFGGADGSSGKGMNSLLSRSGNFMRPRSPIGLGLLDALLGRRDEIPSMNRSPTGSRPAASRLRATAP